MTDNDTIPGNLDAAIRNQDTSSEDEICVTLAHPPGHGCIQSCPEV
jgi:hypothetical protein